MKLVSLVASAALVMTTAMIGFEEPARAQVYPVSVSCEARSPSAVGWGTAPNGDYACRIALNECAVRTPPYQTCTVTRWWYNY